MGGSSCPGSRVLVVVIYSSADPHIPIWENFILQTDELSSQNFPRVVQSPARRLGRQTTQNGDLGHPGTDYPPLQIAGIAWSVLTSVGYQPGLRARTTRDTHRPSIFAYYWLLDDSKSIDLHKHIWW